MGPAEDIGRSHANHRPHETRRARPHADSIVTHPGRAPIEPSTLHSNEVATQDTALKSSDARALTDSHAKGYQPTGIRQGLHE